MRIHIFTATTLPHTYHTTNTPTSQTNTLNTWIQQYHDTCPHTKIVLLGYSSGAIMTLNSLCGEPVGYGANRATHLKGGIYGPSGKPPFFPSPSSPLSITPDLRLM